MSEEHWADRYWTPENLCATCGHPRNCHLDQPPVKGELPSSDRGWCTLPPGTCIYSPCFCKGFVEPIAPEGAPIDRAPRYAPEMVMVCHGIEVPVLRAIAHPPGKHPPHCRLVSTCVALELETAYGSRWWGFEEAHINSELRMVVSGFPAHDALRSRWAKCSTP
jgi:hypothetical protein